MRESPRLEKKRAKQKQKKKEAKQKKKEATQESAAREQAVLEKLLRQQLEIKATNEKRNYFLLLPVVDVLERAEGPLLLGETLRRLREEAKTRPPKGPMSILHAVRAHLGGHVSVTEESRNNTVVHILKLESARGARIELDLLRAKVAKEPLVVAPTAAALSALPGGARSAPGAPSEASYFTERWLPAGFASFGIGDETDGLSQDW